MDTLSPGSYWLETGPPSPGFPALHLDRRVDVAVIGAGITGLSTAMHLKQAGKEVAVLEAA